MCLCALTTDLNYSCVKGDFVMHCILFHYGMFYNVLWDMLQTTGMLVDLPQGVYCIDNDRIGLSPRIAIGANRYIYLMRSEKRT